MTGLAGYLATREAARTASDGWVAFECGDPASVDEPLAEPIAVAPHLLLELDEVRRVGVCARLLAILDGGRPLPLRVAVKSAAKVLCAHAIHRVPLKGSGGTSPSSSYPPLTCAFPLSSAVKEPDAESNVAWILPLPCRPL